MAKLTFNKGERLKSRKDISLLFDEGKMVKSYPVKILYLLDSSSLSESIVKVGVTVPIRNFRKAVHRNRLKRLLREAYRLNKLALNDFCKSQSIQINIMMIYVAREELDFKEINKSVIKGIKRLCENVQSETP